MIAEDSEAERKDARGTQRRQAFVFGEVAEDYERVRPDYPRALFDAIFDFLAEGGRGGGEARILEIGVGTGKATMDLAQRASGLIALEPSARMADIARSNLEGYPNVEVVEATFEEWDARSVRFDLVVAAQAWHWVEGEKYKRAAALLRDQGALAAFWNRAVWPDHQAAIRESVTHVYRELEPQLLDAPAAFPGLSPYGRERVVAREISESQHFGEASSMAFEWTCTYSIDEYIDLLGTQSMHRMLAPARREALMSGIRRALKPLGGSINVAMESRLVMSRRA